MPGGADPYVTPPLKPFKVLHGIPHLPDEARSQVAAQGLPSEVRGLMLELLVLILLVIVILALVGWKIALIVLVVAALFLLFLRGPMRR